jgi:polysaccharide pyruvyl transferase WcaK-like protein
MSDAYRTALKKVGYCGWLGTHNLGDEAIYLAISQLFPNFEFIQSRLVSGADTTLLGGGTILPSAFRPESRCSPEPREYRIGVGLGVRDPEFWNKSRGDYDIRYRVAKCGVDLPSAIRNAPKPVSYTINAANRLLGNKFDLMCPYFFHSDYQKILDYDFDFLSVRGPKSKQILADHNIDSKLVGDTALILEPDELYMEKSTDRIGVCLRGPNRPETYAADSSYIDEIIQFCRSKSDEYQFIYIPFYPGDIPLNLRAHKRTPNSRFVDCVSYTQVQRALNTISSCDYVIGEKLHSCVFAACSHTPFISLGYSPKCIDFAQSIDMENYMIRIDNLNQNNINATFNQLISDRDLPHRIRKQVNEYRKHLCTFSERVIKYLDPA